MVLNHNLTLNPVHIQIKIMIKNKIKIKRNGNNKFQT